MKARKDRRRQVIVERTEKHIQHCVFQSVFNQQPLSASSTAVLCTYSIRHGTAPQFLVVPSLHASLDLCRHLAALEKNCQSCSR